MTIASENSALQKLSTAQWQVDGAYLYTREFTPQCAQEIKAELGEYAVKALGLMLPEGGRKVVLKRSQAESLMAMEGLPLNIRSRGIAV